MVKTHVDIGGKGILLVRSTTYDTLHVKEGDMSGSLHKSQNDNESYQHLSRFKQIHLKCVTLGIVFYPSLFCIDDEQVG